MEQIIQEARTLSSKIKYAGYSDSPASKRHRLTFHKEIYFDGVIAGVEEIVTVDICETDIKVGKSKPRNPQERPQQQAERILAVSHESVGAYANFDRSDAAIESIMNTYVLPLYQ